MITRRIAIAAVVTALAVSACARDDGGGAGGDSDGGDGGGPPTGSNELVLRVEYVGGFVPVEYTLTSVPAVSIYGDGRMIVQGPVIEIYPGPALPNLQVVRVSEEGLAAILEAARDAGLTGGDAHYDYQCVADAATTRFTVTVDGRTSVVEAYALGLEAGDCPDVDTEARAELFEFQSDVTNLASWLPAGSLSREEEFTPAEMRVIVLPYRANPELPQTAVEWPPTIPLEAFGKTVEALPDARCGVVGGDELPGLLAAAREANQLSPWTSGGQERMVLFRPLLPDEHGC